MPISLSGLASDSRDPRTWIIVQATLRHDAVNVIKSVYLPYDIVAQHDVVGLQCCRVIDKMEQ